MAKQGLLKIMRGWRLLPPRDDEFYSLFNEMSETLVEASGKLVELFNTGLQERNEIEVRIATCATICTRIGESIEDMLKVAQQPPFDRAEISLFSDQCQRVMKYINHSANRYMIYDFPSSDKEMRELAPIINDACLQIEKIIKSLPKNRDIEPFCRAVEKLESKADDIYHGGLKRRFREIRSDRASLEDTIKSSSGEISPAELLPIINANVEYTRHVAIFFILRQVYAELERAIDACTDITAALKRMVSKNV